MCGKPRARLKIFGTREDVERIVQCLRRDFLVELTSIYREDVDHPHVFAVLIPRDDPRFLEGLGDNGR